MTNSHEPKSMEPADVVRALRSQSYGEILGVVESQTVEFKQSYYRLSEERQRWELAKDVGALANAGGGIIVRGVATSRLDSLGVDIAQAVKPMPKRLIDVDRHQSVVKDHLYPQVRGVIFEVLSAPPNAEGDDLGILVVEVPAQDADQQPFLVSYAFDSAGRRFDAINIPVRDGARTDWHPPGVIHRDLADGRRGRSGNDAVGVALTAIEPESESQSGLERASLLLTEIETFMGWGSATTFAVAALPRVNGTSVPADFYRAEGMPKVLRSLPEEHYTGFNLSYGEESERVGPNLVVNAGRERVVWLEPSGAFVAALNGEGDLLGWPNDRVDEPPTPLQINQLVVTEYAYLVSRVVNESLSVTFGPYDFVVALRGARDRVWSVELPDAFPSEHSLSSYPPSGDELSQVIRGSGDSSTDAFQLIAAVFDFFRSPRSSMCFADQDREAIDPTRFR